MQTYHNHRRDNNMRDKTSSNKHQCRRCESSSTCLSTSSSSCSEVAADKDGQNDGSNFVGQWDEIEILAWRDLEFGQKQISSIHCGGRYSQKQLRDCWFRRKKLLIKIAIVIFTMICLWIAVYFGAKRYGLRNEANAMNAGEGNNKVDTGDVKENQNEETNFIISAEGDKEHNADIDDSGEPHASNGGASDIFESNRIFPSQSPQNLPLQSAPTDAPVTVPTVAATIFEPEETVVDAPVTVPTVAAAIFEPEETVVDAPATVPTVAAAIFEPEETVVLHSGDSLTAEQFQYSPNGRFKIGITKTDGDLVLLEVNSSREIAVWSSSTSSGVNPNGTNREVKCFMQSDGNLVLRDVQTKESLWMTKTHNNPQAQLVLDDSGRVAVRSDNSYRTVLWMDGIPRQKYTGPSSADIAFPIRGAFYYPWYPSTWHVDGHRAHYDTSLGMYSSSDPVVANAHIEAMDFGGIQLSIASWWGPSTNLDRARLSMLMDETIARNSRLKWTVYHEDERDYDPTPEELRTDLDYLAKWFTWHEAWAHMDGKPVIFVYNEAGCDVASRWVQASRNEWYVVLKLFSGFEDCPYQPDSWHQYGVGKKDGVVHNPGHSFVVSPGFWRADTDIPLLKRLDRTQFCQNTQKMVESNEPWQLIVSFNEAGEGTLIEPSPDWKSDSGYGDYLDCLHDSYSKDRE